ncbi:MAG TPA: CDGSH iron-sulfur domain-containing protein, partial [Polyangiaceae bacterium]
TALKAFRSIVQQGEGAAEHTVGSHYQKFLAMRDELVRLRADHAAFEPAYPAAQNPVLRPPLRRAGRVWIEHEEAAATVDVANSAYALMLRLLAHSYVIARPSAEKSLVVDLALGLMRAVTLWGERAARLPAGPSNPDCHAGMSFTALRDASAIPPGPSARRFFSERLGEIVHAAALLERYGDARLLRASRIMGDLMKRAVKGFGALDAAVTEPPAMGAKASASVSAGDSSVASSATPRGVDQPGPPVPAIVDGLEHIEGRNLTLIYDLKKCIHARFCVTGAPDVFLANVQGPWIQPDAMRTAALVEIAHICPSGAIRYRRKDGEPNEAPPPVNLLAIREAGPYAVRAELSLEGHPTDSYRATLCRCGASKNKPYCDGSHHGIEFAASGEPPTGETVIPASRNGVLRVDPLMDGPLQVRGNLEITSGTGRVVARVAQARLCRCGASDKKPFCDGSHVRVGFRAS